MLPLNFTKPGDHLLVTSVSGTDSVRKHLEDLGFVPGSELEVLMSHGGDMIVKLKDTRLAVTREMASKIKVEEEIKET